MSDRLWWTLWALALLTIVLLWCTAPVLLWRIELLFRAGLTIVALIVIVAWVIWKREHIPSMFLN